MILAYYFGILFLWELWLIFIFRLLARFFHQEMEISLRAFVKGLVERGFLTFALVLEYSQALTLFGALKLGTRLKHQEQLDNTGFNDFYLIGNLISVASAMAYTWLFQFMGFK